MQPSPKRGQRGSDLRRLIFTIMQKWAGASRNQKAKCYKEMATDFATQVTALVQVFEAYPESPEPLESLEEGLLLPEDHKPLIEDEGSEQDSSAELDEEQNVEDEAPTEQEQSSNVVGLERTIPFGFQPYPVLVSDIVRYRNE